ncbi:hypothetical protein P170DRAFT_460880 [Aspergillus steynii IBT 23096]|uniref:Uncharacterized protein n=1 Tax=Aspergillus steynii IBT 23096 TaxID=1392250 RepID=A0A2I2GPS1_9EURO|nr:uncharacterized protein P170DRAFT_460880 [Aspergillus steynii IBT 23096]PLB54874.1 hypothetical protein P170DRAFT_460880 [Aspergillus steynii IBT 23096]
MSPILKTDDLDHRADHKGSEDIEVISFTWTPELMRPSRSRLQVHPYLGPIGSSKEWPYRICQPVTALPDTVDTHECLRWFGLSDEKILQVEERFHELYPDFQGPPCGYKERYASKGNNSIEFPLLDRMVHVYYLMVDHWTSDYEYTHEGYIKKAVQQGLRPEFAAFCGLHKDDPRCIEFPQLFETEWFDRSPMDIITDFTSLFWVYFKEFLTCKLIDEGKAWSDDHGQWLVHDGESLEQAKVRVHDLEFQELRERLYEEERERRTLESEERAREIEMQDGEAEKRMEVIAAMAGGG